MSPMSLSRTQQSGQTRYISSTTRIHSLYRLIHPHTLLFLLLLLLTGPGPSPSPTTALVIPPPSHAQGSLLSTSPIPAQGPYKGPYKGPGQVIDQSEDMTHQRRHPALADLHEPDPDPALQPSPSPMEPSVVQPSATAAVTDTTTSASTQDGRSVMGAGGSQMRTETTQTTALARLGSTLPTGVLGGLIGQPSTTTTMMMTDGEEGGGKSVDESVVMDLNPTKTAARQTDQTQIDQAQSMASSADSPAAASASAPTSAPTSMSGTEGDDRASSSAGQESAGISKRTVVILSVVGGTLALMFIAFTFWRKWVLHTRDDDRARMADIHWGPHALAHTPSSASADASPWQKSRHPEDSSPLSAQAALFSSSNGAEIVSFPCDSADARRSPSPHAYALAPDSLHPLHPQSIIARAPTPNYAFNADNAVNSSSQYRSLI